MTQFRFGSPPAPPANATPYEKALAEYVSRFVQALESHSRETDLPTKGSFQTGTYTASYSLDPSAAPTATQVAAFVCTLTDELRAKGVTRSKS